MSLLLDLFRNLKILAKLKKKYEEKNVKWKNVQNLPENQFRRITGVKYKTVEKMIEIVAFTDKKEHKRRPSMPVGC